jgi:hypothetical protein
MSPLGSISNTQTSANVMNTPAANSQQASDSSGLAKPSNGVELDVNANRPVANASVYDRAELTKQMNQNKSAYASPIGMSLEAKDNDPDNLVLVIDKKALDSAAQELAKIQEEKAAQEAEEAEKAKQEEEDEGMSTMSILGHMATVGTIVSLLV